MVNAADRHGLVHPSCLAKSLTLWWLLGRQGIPSQLRIGTRKEKEKFEAHAWVETRWNVRSTNRMSPTITTPRFDASLSELPRKRHERVRELREKSHGQTRSMRLSRLYLSAESSFRHVWIREKLGMKKAPDNTAGGLRECASATRCWCDARRGVWYARRVPATQQ